MAIMFVSLMFGFIEDAHHYSSGSYSYYYGYSKGYSYYTSFADYNSEIYWPLFALTIAYIAFGIVAIALYNKRIKAINIVNLILTSVVYMFAMIAAFIAIDYGNAVFAIFMLACAVGIAFPFHLVVEIFALIAQKHKSTEKPLFDTPQEPIRVTQEAQTEPTANNDAIEMLKQLKVLYDAGALTEEEYNAKRAQYVSKI